MIGVSFWAYDKASVEQRELQGITETGFLNDLNQFLADKFHLSLKLPGTFIDSFAKQSGNLGDQDQQVAFNRETSTLWDFSTAKNMFMFRTVNDLLEDNQKLKGDIQCLNDVIAKEIADLQKGLKQVSLDSDDMKMEISILQEDKDIISSDVAANKELIDTNKELIDSNQASIENLHLAPLGYNHYLLNIGHLI